MARSVTSYDIVVAIVPNDATDIDYQGLLCTGAGNISIVDQHGNTTTFAAAANVVYPFHVSRVRLTGTTATGILGLN